MATAGYSETALIKKLGIKPEMKVLVIHEPKEYLKLLQADISSQYVYSGKIPDFIHFFASNKTVFEKEMKKILPLCKKNSSVIVWVSWYKKNSAMATDLSEDIVRNYALQHDLVDVKVCAVSNDWSGLKLVVPLAKR
jgi:hypothetical protein